MDTWGPFEGGRHYLHYLHHSLASGQTTEREHSPIHQQKSRLKISGAWPIRTRPSFPLDQSLPSGSFHKPLILLHQKADRMKTSHRKWIKLITWTTALSKSMKLWAMPCRATQDRRVMVENSDKTRSTGEGNGKPLQYSCLENLMNSMKNGHYSYVQFIVCNLYFKKDVKLYVEKIICRFNKMS